MIRSSSVQHAAQLDVCFPPIPAISLTSAFDPVRTFGTKVEPANRHAVCAYSVHRVALTW